MTTEQVDKYTQLYDHIKEGSEYEIEGSLFKGFMVEIATIEEVNDFYMAMKLKHMGARHIICMYRLPGRNFIKFQDGEDDGEHGTSRFILNAMKHCEIFHQVVFVTRYYDGKQIGVKRFEGYLKAARSAIIHAPLIPNRNVMHKPWSEEYCHMTTLIEGDSTATQDRHIGQGRGRGFYSSRGANHRGRGKWKYRPLVK